MQKNLTGILILTAAALGAPMAWAQSSGTLTARTLFYNPGPDESAKPAPKPHAKPVAKRTAERTTETSPTATDSNNGPVLQPVSDTKVTTPVNHLGVRYNLVLVNGGNEQAVDADQTFRSGDCISLRVESNYDAYLYVIEQGSTSKWNVLVPSPLMSDESNIIHKMTTTKIPQNYCFAFDASPGTEHLYLVLSRNMQDVYELNKEIRKNGGASPAESSEPPPERPAPAIQEARLEEPPIPQLPILRVGLKSRDLVIQKVDEPEASGEPAKAMYVVDKQSRPSDRLVTEIVLKHQ